MAYRRVTEGERNQIYALRQAGKGNNEISRLVGRDKGTVSREVRRNTGGRGYRPKQAQELAAARARRPGDRKYTAEMRREVRARLEEGWPPEQVCGRARLEGRPFVCRETVYRGIYKDARHGDDLWERLARSGKRRKKRCPGRDDGRGRGVIPGRRGIETRPPGVELRIEAGHWEGDLVAGAGGTGYLVTLAERATRCGLVGWSRTKEAGPVADTIVRLLACPGVVCRSVTFDNGKEFARHAEIASVLKADVFFARPYHSWERGTNENMNGLIRRLFPKGMSFARITEEDLARLDRFLNDRPRKCLGWKTPREAMAAFLAAAA